MNEYKICPQCRKISVEFLKKTIENLDSTAIISIECVRMCGICMQKAFVILNGIPIICNTEEELIVKLKEKLSS